MSLAIKLIAKASTLQIEASLVRRLPDEEARRAFLFTLLQIANDVQTTSIKKRPTDDFVRMILSEFIGPKKIECTEVTLDNMLIPSRNATMEEIVSYHNHILNLEESSDTLSLIIRYLRGQIYSHFIDIAKTGVNYKKWFPENLGISYVTVCRYVGVFNLIKKWPQIIHTSGSYTDLVKYRKQINVALEQLPEDTKCSWKIPVFVNNQITIG